MVLQLVGLLLFLCMLTSKGRALLSPLGTFALPSLLGLLALVAILAVLRLIQRYPNNQQPTAGTAASTLELKLSSPPVAPTALLGEPASPEELLRQLRAIDWYQFEKVVALAYAKLGYEVTRRGGANADGGIDLIIEKDGQRTAVQCKQWKTWNVGVKAVREFLGALADAQMQRGIFVTLGGYTGDAKQLANKHCIQMLNEKGLAEMLEATNARFDPDVLAILRDSLKFCPKCESEMILRTSAKGSSAGKQFWGCSAYPRCRYTLPV